MIYSENAINGLWIKYHTAEKITPWVIAETICGLLGGIHTTMPGVKITKSAAITINTNNSMLYTMNIYLNLYLSKYPI
jgi:hypothetical protein